jgi:DNA-binding response OmpR family regulator
LSKKRRILVVEDDRGIREGIVDALRFEGHEPVDAATGELAIEKLGRVELDLVLLDLVLPGVSGLDVLQAIRRSWAVVPVIILTARGAEDDRVRGLRAGADDYIVKPFSVRELLARVDAVLRRSPERPRLLVDVRIPGGQVDTTRRRIAFDDGGSEELTEKEFELLCYLAAHSDRPISRDEILAKVWRIAPGTVETRTIDMHVARLREKIRDDGARPTVLVTVRGKGYLFCSLSSSALCGDDS